MYITQFKVKKLITRLMVLDYVAKYMFYYKTKYAKITQKVLVSSRFTGNESLACQGGSALAEPRGQVTPPAPGRFSSSTWTSA